MSTALSHLKHEESLNGKKSSDDAAERKELTNKSMKSQGSGGTRTPKAANVGAVMQAQETKISMKVDKKGPPNEVCRVFIDLFAQVILTHFNSSNRSSSDSASQVSTTFLFACSSELVSARFYDDHICLSVCDAFATQHYALYFNLPC